MERSTTAYRFVSTFLDDVDLQLGSWDDYDDGRRGNTSVNGTSSILVGLLKFIILSTRSLCQTILLKFCLTLQMRILSELCLLLVHNRFCNFGILGDTWSLINKNKAT